MSGQKDQVRIQLTPEQKAQIKNATGKDAAALELSVSELEERIAPSGTGIRTSGGG
ncbi:MAG: hypothetical protein ACM34D_00030 [Gemmatimonadota bacterium]|jgi:hypothetical protein